MDKLTPARLVEIECGAAILALASDEKRRVQHVAEMVARVINQFPQFGEETALARAVAMELGRLVLREMELIPVPADLGLMAAEIRRLRCRLERWEKV